MARAGQGRVTVRGGGDLAGGVAVAELARVGPEDGRQAPAGLVVSGQVEGEGERDAIDPLVGDELFADAPELRHEVGEVGEGLARAVGESADEVVRRAGRGFAAGDELGGVGFQQGDDGLVPTFVGLVEALGAERDKVEGVEERPLAVGRRARAGEVEAAFVHACYTEAVGQRAQQRRAGVAITVLGGDIPEQAGRLGGGVGVDEPGAVPAAAGLVFAHERHVGALGPGQGLEAMLGLLQLDRGVRERRVEHQDAIAVRHLLP